MRFNVIQPFLMSQLAAQAMVDTAGSGSIVNISSRSADLVLNNFVAYAAGKAALNQMTRNLAVELAPRVRVNAIGVGGVATKSLEVVLTDENLRREFDANTPMKRPGTPEDIAAAALYFASPASSWVTGKLLHVDGGTERPSVDVPAPPLRPSAGADPMTVRTARHAGSPMRRTEAGAGRVTLDRHPLTSRPVRRRRRSRA